MQMNRADSRGTDQTETSHAPFKSISTAAERGPKGADHGGKSFFANHSLARFVAWGIAPGALIVVLSMSLSRNPQAASALQVRTVQPTITRAVSEYADVEVREPQARQPERNREKSTDPTNLDEQLNQHRDMPADYPPK